MNETKFLFRPRGDGTASLFRMATPQLLIGRNNPRTGKPYGREIRQSLGTRELNQARQERDLRLGTIRHEQALTIHDAEGRMEAALEIAAHLRGLDDDERGEIESVLVDEAQEL